MKDLKRPHSTIDLLLASFLKSLPNQDLEQDKQSHALQVDQERLKIEAQALKSESTRLPLQTITNT